MMTDAAGDQQVPDFVKANGRSPVVAKSAIESDRGGALYTLESGTVFKLYADEIGALPEGCPKWKNAC